MTFLLELLLNFRHPPSFRSFSSQPLIFNASSRGFFQHLGTVTERCASQPRQAPSRDTQLFPRRPKQLELTGGGVSMAPVPVPMPVTVSVSVSLYFAKRFVSRNTCWDVCHGVTMWIARSLWWIKRADAVAEAEGRDSARSQHCPSCR